MTDIEREYRKNEGAQYKLDGTRDWPAIIIVFVCAVVLPLAIGGVFMYFAG